MKFKEIKNQKDIDFIINIKEEDINKKLIIDLFGEFDNEPRFNPYDIITIPKGVYGPDGNKNKNEFRTTVGLWIFNRYFIEKGLFDALGYINNELTGDDLSKINKKLSYLILENKIDIKTQLKPYLMKQQHLMRFVSILSPNHTMKMLKTASYLRPKKEKLIKQHKEDLEKGDEIVAAKIEKELLETAKNYLDSDPSLDMYKSKSRGSFNNNFKNMFVMRGAIMNPEPGKGFDITTSNYMDGISKDEYAVFANSLVAGAYAKAKNTEVGGTWVKLYLSAFQHLVLDKPGSNCGTKRFIEVELTDKNIESYIYNYIIGNSGQLIELTSENIDKYIGKKVKMRFSSLCESKTGFCNICAGNLYYRLNIKNVGMTASKIPSKVMLLSMKKFHNQQLSIVEMDPMEAFGLK